MRSSVARRSGARRRSSQRVGRAHAAQIVHQREGERIAHRDAIDVGDRQRKAGALQQRAEIAQIGERRDPRRDAAFDFGFGRGERLRAVRSACRRRAARRETGRPA